MRSAKGAIRGVIWLDLAIIGFVVLMAVWGGSRGLLAGALLVVGFVVGALLGGRLGALALEEDSRSPAVTGLALAGAVLIGAALGSAGTALRSRLRTPVPERLRFLDGLGGALLLAALALGLTWLVAAVAEGEPPDPEGREPSRILAALDSALPPSRLVLNALAIRPVPRPSDPVPRIRVEVVPPPRRPPLVERTPRVGPPDPTVIRDRDVQAARGSVVRVLGTACGRSVQGSGWVAKEGVVVTNAHLVAGQRDTRVELQDGSRHEADAIWYAPRHDLAILRASGVASAGVRPLKLRLGAPPGTSAAILGFPGGGPYRVVAGRLGPTQTVTAQDSYGRGPIEKSVSALRGRVRRGNSGGPLVDRAGRVVTTVMLANPSMRRRQTPLGVVNGFGIPASIVHRALRRADERVRTGPCGR